MPWKSSDAKRFKKGLTPKQSRQWAYIANGTLKKCQDEGGEDCEKRAIMAANGSTGKKETEVMLEILPTEDEVETEQMEVKGYVPYGITSFAQLKSYREAEQIQIEAWQTADDFMGLVNNIMTDPVLSVSEKMNQVSALSVEMSGMVGKESEQEEDSTEEVVQEREEALTKRVATRVLSFIKSIFKKEDEIGDMMVWKESDGEYRWLARYSNNFRDDDHPAEIISAKSHLRFVEKVDNGEAPLPELWVWHIPEFSIGKANWVAYDDTGFALAAGVFHPGCEPIAETLSKQKGILLSHGMPVSTIKRDETDETVIVEHETREISVLPSWAAANKHTGFVMLSKEEADMAIPQKKVDALRREWGEDAVNQLLALEGAASADAKSAETEGRESKEKAAPPAPAPAPAAEQEPPKQESGQPAAPPEEEDETEQQPQQGGGYATIEEVADAFAKIVKPFTDGLAVLAQTVEGMAKEIAELKEKTAQLEKSQDEQIEKQLASTPAASLGALIARQLSATQAEATRVDGRSTLAKSAPVETQPAIERKVGIPFIDEMLSRKTES